MCSPERSTSKEFASRALNAQRVREQGAQRPRPNAGDQSAIFPLIVGDEKAALNLAAALQGEGFFVPAIRYPTVAKGVARLRITVTAAHKEDQIRALCEAIKRLRP